MAYKTDYARVQGLGQAHEGVHHWWMQRLTSVALVPLTVLFLIPFGRALGGGYEAMLATYGNFYHATVAVLFIAVSSWHFSMGLQVVIEDYVPAKGLRLALVLATKLISAVIGTAGVLAVATILFGA